MMNKDFWKKYESKDYFERRELLKTLPMMSTLVKHRKDYEDDIWEYDFYSRVQSYIDDAIDYMDRAELERNGGCYEMSKAHRID